jgi:hypothetical protein
MTTLRQKMIEDMQLHSFAKRTQDSYLRVVRQLAEYFNKPPDQRRRIAPVFSVLEERQESLAQHDHPGFMRD